MVKIKNPMTIVSSGGSATLVSKTITANGQYNPADDNADGDSDVTVAVPAPANKFKSLVDRSITSVTAEDLAGVTSIGASAFRYCASLTSVTIPDSVTSIGGEAFSYCTALTSIIIPDSVTSIGWYSLSSCISLTHVNIPDSVNRIADGTFRGCAKLTSVTIYATTPPALANSGAFLDTNNCPIYVPSASVAAYKTATNWSAFADRIFEIQE